MPYIPRISHSGYKVSLRPRADTQLKQDVADAFYDEEKSAVFALRDMNIFAMRNHTYSRQVAIWSLFDVIEAAAKKHQWASDWNTKIDAVTISELAEDIVSLWEDSNSELAHFVVQVKAKPGRGEKGVKWENHSRPYAARPYSVFFSDSDARDFIKEQRRLDGTPASAWRVVEGG